MELSSFLFLLKKLLTPLVLPLGVALELILVGLFLRHLTALKKTGRAFFCIGILTLYAFSTRLVADLLVRKLEYRYPPLTLRGDDGSFSLPAAARAAKWVVLLGGSHGDFEKLPANSRLDPGTLARVVETIRVHRLLPGSRLLMTGGALFTRQANAELTSEVAIDLGVDPNAILRESKSLDTADQAVFVKQLIKDDPFILVTSATHMPRSMWLFQRQGLQPIAAPTSYSTFPNFSFELSDLLPSLSALQRSQTAMHEYIGVAWSKLVTH